MFVLLLFFSLCSPRDSQRELGHWNVGRGRLQSEDHSRAHADSHLDGAGTRTGVPVSDAHAAGGRRDENPVPEVHSGEFRVA